jgi:hypothetical protein
MPMLVGVEKVNSIAGDQKVIYIPATVPSCAARSRAKVGAIFKCSFLLPSAARTRQDMAEGDSLFFLGRAQTLARIMSGGRDHFGT